MTARQNVAPVFDHPPVIEAVLGVQFAPIPGVTSGHFGWFWKNFLDPSWVKALEATSLADQFEIFGEQEGWKLPLLPLTPAPAVRLQIINAEDDRVIQVQNTRFIYNWRRRDSLYPSFEKLYPAFSAQFEGFRGFLRAAGLDDVSPNQWEVTYINHLPKGGLWETPEDWHEVLPGLYPPPGPPDGVRFESGSVEWHFEIAPRRGRLHVSGQHGRLQGNGGEVLGLQLTARGPVDQDKPDWGLGPGLELGHRASVRTFTGLASEAALKHWGIR